MSVRKARAWATFCTGVLIVVLALIVEVLTMPKYNGYDLPVLPESEYQNAYIAVSGDTAYLYFVDKQGYIQVDPDGLGNIYTLGLTTADPYDESKILFAEKYTATIGGDSWTAEELPDLSGVYDIPAYAQFSLPCEIGGPVWSNVTLLDQNGNVFIEGSKPIDVVASARRRYSYTLGYLMVVCAPPLKLPDKQPTAYSYNGVILPKLPEWDKTVYPYAVIARTVGGIYRLYVFDTEEPLYVRYNTNGNIENMTINISNGQTFDEKDGEWVFNEDSQGVLLVAMFLVGQHRSEMVWSNYDIPYQNTIEDAGIVAGEIYFAASEPVPVKE